MEPALAAPRLDTDGTLELGLDKRTLRRAGGVFQPDRLQRHAASGAYVGAVSYDPKTRRAQGQAGAAV
jgi:hypothetical protein